MSKATIAEHAVRTSGVRASEAACPHCDATCGTPNLLTSMTRYYVCGACDRRWNVARNWQGAATRA